MNMNYNCGCFGIALVDEDGCFILDFGEVTEVNHGGGGDPYPGPYTVTPQVTAQTLQTRTKTMTQDLTVSAIPYEEINNQYGKTALIAN